MNFYWLWLLALPCSLGAEYRIYQYYVSSPTTVLEGPNALSPIITSSLDPVSYTAFHGGSRHIRLDLLRTWICPGDTARKPYCPGPYPGPPQQQEAPAFSNGNNLAIE